MFSCSYVIKPRLKLFLEVMSLALHIQAEQLFKAK